MASTKNGIIYPDNYDKVADVPADMKVLAESVDGNIERINKNLDKNADELKNLQKDNTGNKTAIEAINKKNREQDTNIQKNVKDIEANQNNIKALQVENAEVKAENERLRSDIESISLVGEAEGESIDLDDSSGARFKKFEIGGNYKQETRNGYNKFKPFESSNVVSANGTTVKIENEKITINGACTKQWWCEIYYRFGDGTAVQTEKKEELDLSKTYTFALQRMSGDITQGYVNATVVIDENNTQIGGPAIATSNKDGTSKTFNNGNGLYRAYLYIPQNAVFNNLELGVLICEGSEAKDWEQYGATPSLKIPSEIKTVKDNINEVVCNKNLQKNKWKNKTSAGASSNYRSTINIDDMNLKLNKKYVIQFKCNVDYSNSTVFVENSITGESLQISKLLYDNINKINYCVIEITEAIKALINKNNCYIVIFNATGMDVNTYSEEMIFEGENKATDYEAHQEQTITMPVQQEMLDGDYFDFENNKQTNLFEKIILDGVNKKCTTSKAVGNGSEFQWAFTIVQSTSYIRKVYSNIAKQASDFNQINGIKISANSNIIYVRSEMKALNGKEATAENVNELLKTMYDNGNPAVFYIEKASNKELAFTDEQKVVAKKIKETLHTYKNITHIYSTDETSPKIDIEYAKDLNTQNNNLQNQIDEIKQLISTTQTSAMLLDNLQKEVESEVE